MITQNIYRYQFKSRCPVNGEVIAYRLEIHTELTPRVETILEACDIPAGYHEDIADQLFCQFGGLQILTAHHHGVDIETRRQ